MANQISSISNGRPGHDDWLPVLKGVAKMTYGHGGVFTKEGRNGGEGYIGLLDSPGHSTAGYSRVVKFGTRHILPSFLSNEATEEAVLACNNLKALLLQALAATADQKGEQAAEVRELQQSLRPVEMGRDAYCNADLLSRKVVARVLRVFSGVFGDTIWDGCDSNAYKTSGLGMSYGVVTRSDELVRVGTQGERCLRYSDFFMRPDILASRRKESNAELSLKSDRNVNPTVAYEHFEQRLGNFIPFDPASPTMTREQIELELVRHSGCSKETAAAVLSQGEETERRYGEKMVPAYASGKSACYSVAAWLYMAMRNRDIRKGGYYAGDLRTAWLFAVKNHCDRTVNGGRPDLSEAENDFGCNQDNQEEIITTSQAHTGNTDSLDAFDLLYGIAQVKRFRNALSLSGNAGRVWTAIQRFVDEQNANESDLNNINNEQTPSSLTQEALTSKMQSSLSDDIWEKALENIFTAFLEKLPVLKGSRRCSKLLTAGGGGLRYLKQATFKFSLTTDNKDDRTYFSVFEAAGKDATTESRDDPIDHPVTNLGYSSLQDGNKNVLVGFIRHGQAGAFDSPLGASDASSTGHLRAIHRYKENLLGRNPSRTQALYRIDMTGRHEGILKTGLITDQKFKKSVKCFRLPIDSPSHHARLSEEEMDELNAALNDILARANVAMREISDEGKRKKIAALSRALLQGQTRLGQLRKSENGSYDVAGQGRFLCKFGALVANLVWQLGDIPTINCHQGRDRTGIMDCMIKYCAIRLERVAKGGKEIDLWSTDSISPEQMLHATGNAKLAKLATLDTYEINPNQSDGASGLNKMFK